MHRHAGERRAELCRAGQDGGRRTVHRPTGYTAPLGRAVTTRAGAACPSPPPACPLHLVPPPRAYPSHLRRVGGESAPPPTPSKYGSTPTAATTRRAPAHGYAAGVPPSAPPRARAAASHFGGTASTKPSTPAVGDAAATTAAAALAAAAAAAIAAGGPWRWMARPTPFEASRAWSAESGRPVRGGTRIWPGPPSSLSVDRTVPVALPPARDRSTPHAWNTATALTTYWAPLPLSLQRHVA